MAYIAEKPVRFDRSYNIGETIPDNVVDPARAPQLLAMGLIRPIAQETEASPTENGIENASEVPETAEDAPAETEEKKKAAKK